jgi:hypothetical protein
MDLIDGGHAQHIHHHNRETAGRAVARTTQLFKKPALEDMPIPQFRKRIAVGEIAHLAARSQGAPQADILAHKLIEDRPARFDLRGNIDGWAEFFDGNDGGC